ncbi:MAG: SpaA isopeptide-forming pilin-related protein [Clostridiales bacterium]|nr:SpaA isopeptide-forming pilin-related protein [Clostridiales bacterium]
MKKALALILTLIMVLGLMPAAMAATEPASPQQIGHYAPANDTNGTLGEPTKGTPSEKTLEDGKVIISKTIAGTETENVFDITLTVKTTEEIKEVTSETADAAVVLVIDISNSMTRNMMANAQKAAQAFINSFAPAEGDTSTRRKIAIVAFGTYAYQISGWVDASTLKTASGEVHSTISGIKPNINEDTGGTNMHAGLLKASELLKDIDISSISNKNVLLFTDGVPTYYINDKGELGSFGNTNGFSQIEHDNHAKVETTVRDNFSGIGKYAVYLGNERIYCSERDECPLYGYDTTLFGNHGGEDVKNWLKSLKSSDGTSFAAYSTSNASELANIFKSISELIKLKAQAWQLTDPMGDNIEFVQFLDENIDNKQATQSDGTISWDLKRDITKVHDGANKAYTYTLSYRIKLNTLSSGFAKDTFYKTNGVTDLTYFIEEQGTAGGLKHAYFNVPSVKGFAGDLTFTKVGANNEPLAGAAFKITANDDPNWSMDGTPSADGTSFTFTGIPSGHTYTLTETKTPEGYQGLDDTYTVEVAYGVAVLKKGADTVTAIVNTPKETPTGSLTIEKVFTFEEGEDPNTRPDSITFTVQQIVKEDQTDGYEKEVTLTPNNNWEEKITVPVGEYTVTEGDATIEGYTYTPVQNPTGNITVAATGTAAVTFTNTYKKLPPDTKEITFNVSKTVEQKGNVAPGTNTFNFVFTIEGSEDAAINNSDYIVTIGGNTITPDATGKYGFPITVNGATTQTVQVKVQGKTAKIDNIAGLKVSETGTAPEYWTYDNKEAKSAQAEVAATFTNTYTENTVEANGSLTIKKEFGSDSAITADNWAGLTNNKQLTFTITKAGATAGTTVTLPTNDTTNPWTYTVNNLPVGEYTVTETGAEDGYGLTVTNKTDITTAADGNTGTVTVTGDETSTITFTNTYEKINADLVVYKNVTGNRGNYSSKAFTFRLTLTQPTFEVVAAGNVAQAPVNSAPPEINYSSPWYRIVRQDGTKEEGSVTVGMALEFNLGNGERLELYANGDRYDYEVKETNSLGHDTTVNGNDKGTIDVEKPTTVTFNNYKSGGGHYYPTPDPVPPIVIPPKTGDMTIWQSILHFLGIR